MAIHFLNRVIAIILVILLIFGSISCVNNQLDNSSQNSTENGDASADNIENGDNPADNGDSSPDTILPVISGITVSNITATTATISWTTSEQATCKLKYGTTSSYGSTKTVSASPATEHSISLTGLLADTTYQFQVVADYSSDLGQLSGDQTFTTTSPTVSVPPEVDFTVLHIHGVAPFGVQFYDQSIGEITNWAWDFDNDGTVDSTQQNPTYTYDTPGTYTVLLEVTGPGGSDIETKIDYIEVYGPPVAGFSASQTSGSAPLNIQFTDQSIGEITNWEWDFDNDGTVDSTEQNPSHIYETPGIYTVSLTVTSSGLSDAKIMNDYINVNPPIIIGNIAIAFTSKRDGNYPEIYIMNADGSDQTRLTYGNDTYPNYNNSTPDLSPDGTKIAFTSDNNENHNNEIYVMNADGSNLSRLTNNNYGDSDPVWSPDGTKIAFVSNRNGTSNIFIMNANGSSQNSLTVNGGTKPTWSPDGTKIAFVYGQDAKNIYVINVDGTNETQITNEQPGYIYGISWSPVCNKIVYDSIAPYDPTPGVPDYYSRGLFIINADGTERTALPVTRALQNACRPVWSPDGSMIAFSTTRYPPTEIYVVNADGSGLIQLTDTDSTPGLGGNSSPSWR